MKPNLLVAGDSFAEFPTTICSFNSLLQRPIKEYPWAHWCELWANSQGGRALSVGLGGAGNAQAVNAAVRSLAQDTYTHCVYFLTDPNRCAKRGTEHLKRGDNTWDKRDYVERRATIIERWQQSSYQDSITTPPGELVERISSAHANLNHSKHKDTLRWEWIKYAMDLAPTFMPIQETVASLALLNSACNSRGVKLMVTSGFEWPSVVESWHAQECYPQFTKFDYHKLYKDVINNTAWNKRSHYDAKGHARIFKLLRKQGLSEWLT
jgi:hypothetical protein